MATTRKSPGAKKARAIVLTNYDEHDLYASIHDMLTDLRHLCDQYGIDFAEQDRVAYANYLNEVRA